MVKAKNRRSRLGRLENLAQVTMDAVELVPERQVESLPFSARPARAELVIFDDGNINATLIEREQDDTYDLERLEQQIRKELCGRPIQFKLAQEDNGLAVSAVVPTFYSKQLLLRAVQQASAPTAVLDRICVPYPSSKAQ